MNRRDFFKAFGWTATAVLAGSAVGDALIAQIERPALVSLPDIDIPYIFGITLRGVSRIASKAGGWSMCRVGGNAILNMPINTYDGVCHWQAPIGGMIFMPKEVPIEIISDPDISWGLGVEKGRETYGICGQGSMSAQQMRLGRLEVPKIQWEDV